ncbi:RecQ family ATP-dependent DNA helicase [Bacillus solitudinis]|uniref:RecQ family ATP-dependent DNA helicase n=1 Tax=Bacillus solitudinis TaxID=2014074 RepID=UPI000C241101|nr:ATP-dependent DNA helicase RecQ [Bacillus solitudinis]
MVLEKALKTWFGYSTFRPGQKEIIKEVLTGRDVLAVLPTGTGKSICYQLPALISKGLTLVVSPLLSLMEDQVQELKSTGIKSVAAINSFTEKRERDEVMSRLQEYNLIYTSPEMLQSPYFQQKLKKCSVSLFVIDEAHCLSQWGHDFRTDYLRLAEVRQALDSPPCLAITATATEEVQHDILRIMNMKARTFLYSVDRSNLCLSVESFENLHDKLKRLKSLIKTLKGNGMVYFSSRAWTESTALMLQNEGIEGVSYYHGGMTTEDRLLIQQQFMSGQLQLICCTSAFGMGINKKDIRYVIHFHYPLQLESYVQEIGRAGRDGENSLAVLLYCKEDQKLAKALSTGELLSDEQIRVLLTELSTSDYLSIEKERHLSELTGCSENAWQTLRYQLESRGVLQSNKIRPFSLESLSKDVKYEQDLRALDRQKKLYTFEAWIHSATCKREKLLAYFSEELKSKPVACCHVCGFNIQKYQDDLPAQTKDIRSWEEMLATIFLQYERNET